jgi:hypothetical protein
MNHIYPSIEGWFDDDFRRLYSEALDLAPDCSENKRPMRFVEVGCWAGKSLSYLLVEAKNRNKHIEVHAVDTWKGSPDELCHQERVAELGGSMLPTFCANLAKHGLLDNVTIHTGESKNIARRFHKTFGNAVDFVCIDAQHTFDAVRMDLCAWWPSIAWEGHLAGHDWNYQAVKNAVAYFLKMFGQPPPVEVVGELCWRTKWSKP